MGIESASYVNQLVPSNPLSTDSVSQADDHLRIIKTVLKNTFPNLDSPVTATPTQINNPIPSGVVLMWSGLVAGIPSGYALCDGTNGTPDLRNKFVVGAGDLYDPNSTGGDVVTGFGGSHTHTANTGTANLSATTLAVAAGVGETVVSAEVDTGHTHTINEVGDHTHPSLPPYMALCYIMKL